MILKLALGGMYENNLGRHNSKEYCLNYQLSGFQLSRTFENSGTMEEFENFETMEDFNEEDIWGGINDPEAKQVWDDVHDPEAKQLGLQESWYNGVAVCRSVGIEEENGNNSSRSINIPWKATCHEENNRRRMSFSAPVDIPDWSQMVRKEKKNENYWKGSDGIVGDNSDDDARDYESNIPPHELIARQLAQRGIASFSVYEGVGRTLKGRDLYRVRNAVWTRTGFIE